MTEAEKKDFKKKINEEIKKMEERIAQIETMTQPIAPENSIGRISRMDAINNKSVSEAALRSAKRKLAKLKNALTNVDMPNFGKCSNCKRPIPPARLMLMPESTKCVNCAR